MKVEKQKERDIKKLEVKFFKDYEKKHWKDIV